MQYKMHRFDYRFLLGTNSGQWRKKLDTEKKTEPQNEISVDVHK